MVYLISITFGVLVGYDW